MNLESVRLSVQATESIIAQFHYVLIKLKLSIHSLYLVMSMNYSNLLNWLITLISLYRVFLLLQYSWLIYLVIISNYSGKSSIHSVLNSWNCVILLTCLEANKFHKTICYKARCLILGCGSCVVAIVQWHAPPHGMFQQKKLSCYKRLCPWW